MAEDCQLVCDEAGRQLRCAESRTYDIVRRTLSNFVDNYRPIVVEQPSSSSETN